MNKVRDLFYEPKRFLYAAIFSASFTIIGYFAPLIYLRYIDNTRYIDVIEPVSFDRKVYSAGETQIAKLVMDIGVDSDTVLNSRLMLILSGDNKFTVINQSTAKGFAVAQEETQTFIIPAKLPCNLKNGEYFYRAELRYWIRGVEKYTGFETDLFSINNQRASDSAQIKENCEVK